MGFCTRRYFLLSICLLQLLAIVERQVFDFLGYLWIPILVNFFEIIFVIFGFFGGFQYRPKYILAYSIWHMFWLGWNIFLICLYLDIGVLDHKTSKVIKLDPQSGTWWVNGPGCQRILSDVHPPRVEDVTGCYVDYQYIEIAQAGLQCILAFFGITTGFCLSKLFMEEDDSFNYMGGNGRGPQHVSLRPMYVKDDFVPTPLNPSSDRNSLLVSPRSEQIFFGDSFTPSSMQPMSSFRHNAPKSLLITNNYD